MQQESTRQNVKIEVPVKGVDGSLSYLSEKLDQCMKTTGTRFRSLSAKRDHIEGEFGPVRDFDAFCDCAGKLNFVKSVERDAKRRWVLINVDWEIVATQLPERTDGFGRGFDGGFPMDDLTDEFADPLADVAAETMPAEDSPEYYEVLVAKLKSGDIRAEREAAEALLKKSPKDLPNKAIHKSIAKAFLGLAKSPIPPTQELGIQGIVRFAGKQSVKPLAQMLKASMLRANPLIYDSLAKFPCEESAKAVASRLGNTFDTSLPIRTLIKMKEFAEPVAIEALHTNSPLRAAGAAQVLEYVGTSKCRSILRKAQAAGDPGVSRAARDALFAIQKRMEKNGD